MVITKDQAYAGCLVLRCWTGSKVGSVIEYDTETQMGIRADGSKVEIRSISWDDAVMDPEANLALKHLALQDGLTF